MRTEELQRTASKEGISRRFIALCIELERLSGSSNIYRKVVTTNFNSLSQTMPNPVVKPKRVIFPQRL